MQLKKIADFFEQNKAVRFIERALNSIFFPLLTAVVAVGCYFLGWDLVTIWYVCICGTAIMVCCKDATPVLCLLLFINILVSMQHSPSTWVASDFFSRKEVLAQAITGVSVFGAAMLARIVCTLAMRTFKITPMFLGVCALGAAFVLSGALYGSYFEMNAIYGLGLAAILAVVFLFASGNFHPDKKSFKRVSLYFIALFASLTVELAAVYIFQDGVIVDGSIRRELIRFGWGSYNQFGLLITMCMPAWFYLALKMKHGWAFLLGGAANFAVAVLCMSRQAILMSAVLLVICCVWYLIASKKRERIIGGSMMAGALVAAAVVMGVMHEKFATLFYSFTVSLSTGSGRIQLWEKGFTNFLHHPAFGVGFYDPEAAIGEPGYFASGLSRSVPVMCHNTIVQLLSSCGAVGLVAYLVHRVQTVISFVRNVNSERVLVALLLCAMLLVSLLDNHIFYFTPTLIYAALISLLAATEKKESVAGEEQRKKA